MNKIHRIAFSFTSIALLVILYACANRGMPEGGPKDENPPVVLKELPASGTVNFKEKQVDIYFDEYIQLKDIQTKFVISPPQKKKPKVSLRGKYIRVTFVDSLKPNTTYTLDFADAIADNNEGNPFGYYRYVFSTGPAIDSMELGGKVIDAQTQLPLLNMSVWFYENHADSAALTELPSYMARTDSSGMFRVTNMKRGAYRVLAIDDANKDLIFTPEGEKVGFIDSLIVPVMERVRRLDTIRPDTMKVEIKRSKRGEVSVSPLTKDTIVERDYTLYGPSNLLLSLFEEDPSLLLLEDESRPMREQLVFKFSIPGDNQLKLRLLGVHFMGELDEKDWYLMERTTGNDSLTYWIKDSAIYQLDTLILERSYLRSDSLRRLQPFRDTVKLYFKDKVIEKKKKEDNTSPTPPKTTFLGLNVKLGQEQDLHQPITLEFDKPIHPESLQKIVLQQQIDSNWIAVDYQIHRDSLQLRTYYINVPWKPETTYQLRVDSATLHNIYGQHNDKLEKTFKTRSNEFYGKIIVNLKGVTIPVLLQLYKGDKDIKIVEERHATHDGKVTFDYLPEDTYMLRAILDRNGNKQWDTGNYMKHRQPEEIKYFPTEINLKQNFDVEQEFDVSQTYTREDPAKKKAAEEKNKKRR